MIGLSDSRSVELYRMRLIRYSFSQPPNLPCWPCARLGMMGSDGFEVPRTLSVPRPNWQKPALRISTKENRQMQIHQMTNGQFSLLVTACSYRGLPVEILEREFLLAVAFSMPSHKMTCAHHSLSSISPSAAGAYRFDSGNKTPALLKNLFINVRLCNRNTRESALGRTRLSHCSRCGN